MGEMFRGPHGEGDAEVSDKPMTDSELAAIKAKCDAATPGPWDWDTSDSGETLVYAVAKPDENIAECNEYSAFSHPNADFIVSARKNVPRLVAEVERLRADLARERAKVKQQPE